MAKRQLELSNRPLRATKADQALFADREGEVEALLDAATNNLNAILVGERGSGKTSLLHRLVASTRQATTPTAEIVRIDAHLAKSAARILLAVADGLGVDAFPAPAFLKASSAAFGNRPPAQLPGDEDNPLALLDAIRRIGQRGRVVVALDGASSGPTFTLFGRLRDELWEQPTRWILAVDREQYSNVIQPPADAFFERTVSIQPLDGPAVRSLLRLRGLSVNQQIADDIAVSARGNPRKVLGAAREIAASPDVDSATERVTTHQQERDHQLASLPAAARMLHDTLLALDRPVSASDEELLAQLRWTRPRAVAVLRQLEQAGLVESGFERSPDNRPGRPRRTFRLVAG